MRKSATLRWAPLALAGLLALSEIPVAAVGPRLFGPPRVPVVVKHDAALLTEAATRIAVADLDGACGVDLADRITSALTNTGRLDVLSRAHVTKLMRENNFDAGGLIDSRPGAAQRLGQVLGAGALVVGSCRKAVEQHRVMREVLFSKTPRQELRVHASVSATLQIVDLATFRIYSAEVYEGNEERAYDLPPDEATALKKPYDDVVERFTRTLVPWTEAIELAVYDDKEWSLKAASVSIRLGEFAKAEEALRAAISANESGAVDTKLLSKAYHDLGVSLIGAGRFEEAEAALNRSLSLRPTADVKEAIGHARRLAELKGRAPKVITAVSRDRPAAGRTCGRCKAALPTGAKFCPTCGKPVAPDGPAACANPKCGKPLPKGARFCPLCGTPASSDAP